MKLEEIKQAVSNGLTVCWLNPAYQVQVDKLQQWTIHCTLNGHKIGLTWDDEVTLNANEDEFFILRKAQSKP